MIKVVLQSGRSHTITDERILELQGIYGNIDVLAELKALADWNECNPAKRKTSAGIKRHIQHWLKRAGDKGGSNYRANVAQTNKDAVRGAGVPQDFATALAGLGVVINQRVSVEQIQGICAVLNNYPDEVLVQACQILAKTCRFMPKPIDFIDVIERGELPEGDVKTQATLAWSRLQFVWTNSTRVAELCNDKHIDAGVQALGGWFNMVNSCEQPQWQRSTFISAYIGSKQEQVRQSINPTGQLLTGEPLNRLEG